jgi:hypothetical protein
MEAILKGVSKSNVDVSAGETAGDAGKGVEVGDSGCSVTGIGAGVDDLDNSAAASFARSLSSKFDLGALASGRLLLFDEWPEGPGLPDRAMSCEPLRRGGGGAKFSTA